MNEIKIKETKIEKETETKKETQIKKETKLKCHQNKMSLKQKYHLN